MEKSQKGFILVEIVIVIAILASVLIPTFSGIIERARNNTKLQIETVSINELYELFVYY